MPTFAYEALDAAGQRQRGVLEAVSEQSLLTELASRRLQPISVRERGEAKAVFGGGVSARQLAEAYTQLADLLSAGVSVMRSLAILANRRSRRGLADAFRRVSEVVAEGGEFSEAMTQQPAVFPRVHTAMVRAGERGGFLERVFAQLGDFVEKQADLRSKVVGSLVYPGVLVGIGSLVLVVIFTVFIPMLRPALARQEAAGELPIITVALFAASERLVFVAGGIVAAIGGMGLLLRVPAVQRRADEALTRAPVIGPLVRTVATIRFCRMLGTMEANGVPLLQAMGIAREAAGNVLLERAIERATEAVRSGEQLAPPLVESGLFAEDVVEMIRVGEAAGNVDTVLLSIAATLESRLDRLLATVTRLIEPLLLAAIAGVVLLVATGILLPLMNLTSGLE